MIYIASSWNNEYVEAIADCLDQWDIHYYNFKDEGGFHWSMVQPGYKEMQLTLGQYKQMLEHPAAENGFERDMDHLVDCSGIVCVLPCGRSAHLELGWAKGAGKPTAIFFREFPVQPELMYRMIDLLTEDIDELMRWCSKVEADKRLADRLRNE